MYEIIKYNTEEEWLKIRQQGIGGSDVAILMGLSSYMSPLELWEDKRVGLGLSDNQLIFKPTEPTICAERGKALEPVALNEYQREEKCIVNNIEGVLRSKEYPFMQATLDGYVRTDKLVTIRAGGSGGSGGCGESIALGTGGGGLANPVANEDKVIKFSENKLVEIKTVSIFQEKEWGDPDDEQIPPNYYLQVQHYMIVTGFKVCDVAVLFMSKDDVKVFTIQADLETQTIIIDREKDFWASVNNGIAPAAESRDISITYAKSNGKAIEINPVIKCAYKQLLIIQPKMKELKKEKEELEDEIKLYLGNYDTLTDGEAKAATWMHDKAKDELDIDALKQAHPDIYNKFTKKVEGSRRFLIKKEE